MAKDAAEQLSPSGNRCPALVIMVGAPGSGKSYLARTLSAALGADLVQTDAVRKELFPDPRYTSAEHATVYETCRRRIADLLGRGACVIFDGTNLREKRRRALYQLAERAGAQAIVVVAYASDEVIRARLRQRAEERDPEDQSDADLPIYLRMRRDVEPVPRPHIVVNTAAAPGPVIRLLERRLAEGRGARGSASPRREHPHQEHPHRERERAGPGG